MIPTYLANDCLIAIAVEMRDTNALRADGPDNWSILCCGREGTTTKERDLSCKTDDSHLDETTPEPWPCLAVCKWTGITYPALSSDIFSHASFEPILRCGGGRAAGMEVWFGVVWCSPQIIKF